MFCKRCRYNLKLIESNACPECGRGFDPQNAKTYRKGVGMPKWVRHLGKVTLMLFVVAAIAIGVIEWRYQREAGAAEVMKQLNGSGVRWSDDAHQWAQWNSFLHERLQHVFALTLATNQLTKLPPEIGKLTKLEYLYLQANQLTTLPLEIGNLAELKLLWLKDNQLTKLPPEIAKLTKLEGLSLDGNPITDADLEHLKSLENLVYLSLSGTKVTLQGVAALKLALPNCEIPSDFDQGIP